MTATIEDIWGDGYVTQFSNRPVTRETINKILEIAHRSPSNYNLQPWHFIVIDDPSMRGALSQIAMEQESVRTAPVTILFASDNLGWKANYNTVLDLSQREETLNTEQVKFYKRSVKFLLKTGVIGFSAFIKKLLLPILRLRAPRPTPMNDAHDTALYLATQSFIVATTSMVVAKSLGLECVLVDAFDEQRLKKLLGVPKRFSIPVAISLGYPIDGFDKKVVTRLPLKIRTSFNKFGNWED